MSRHESIGSTPVGSPPESPCPTGMVAPSWESEKEVKDCNGCSKEFGVFRRKHHCRGCGLVFCDDCTQKKIELPAAFKQEGKQRVCGGCFLAIMQTLVEANPDLHPPKPDFPKLHEDLKTRLRTLLSDDTKKWNERAETKGVKLFTLKEKESPLWFVKSVVIIPLPLEKVFTLYKKKEIWKNWFPDMNEYRTVEPVSSEPGQESEVGYISYTVPVIDNRDTLTYSAIQPGTLLTDRADCRCIISQSVSHPLCPVSKKFVRAHVNMSITTFIPVSAESTEVTSVVHADPRGLIPPFLVNQLFSKAADSIADMRAFMIKNPDA